MRVRKLKVHSFRNLSNVEFEPDARLNFFTGLNGQGKTSVLEAIGFLATLRSFRRAKAPDVIQRSAPAARVLAEVEEAGWRSSLEVHFELKVPGDPDQGATKKALVNGKPFRSSAQYLAKRFGEVEIGFHAIVFNPEDHDLVKDEPAIRRQYLDSVCSAEDVGYLQTLSRFQKALDQRNRLLKFARENGTRDHPLLEALTEVFVKEGAQLTQARFEWLKKALNPLNNALRQIAPSQRPLGMRYFHGLGEEIPDFSGAFAGQEALLSLEILEQILHKKLSQKEEAEWRSGHTLVGPHREDWQLQLGDTPLKGFGSQGEVRSSLLALKLTELELFQERTGHRPVFLLDDFSSELDETRRRFLLTKLLEKDLQVFVTSTEAAFRSGRHFIVRNGEVEIESLENSDGSKSSSGEQRLLSRQD